jgi:hypothetical protein
MTEASAVNKPRAARPLGAFLKASLGESFARQGFASAELVTRWSDIVGPEVGAHSEPVRIKWARDEDDGNDPTTLVLRVEGPAALEIQHLSAVIIERVNRFFGWQAIGRLALRQAPLSRRRKEAPPCPDAEAAARIAATLGEVRDDGLRQALARLGAAIKRP